MYEKLRKELMKRPILTFNLAHLHQVNAHIHQEREIFFRDLANFEIAREKNMLDKAFIKNIEKMHQSINHTVFKYTSPISARLASINYKQLIVELIKDNAELANHESYYDNLNFLNEEERQYEMMWIIEDIRRKIFEKHKRLNAYYQKFNNLNVPTLKKVCNMHFEKIQEMHNKAEFFKVELIKVRDKLHIEEVRIHEENVKLLIDEARLEVELTWHEANEAK